MAKKKAASKKASRKKSTTKKVVRKKKVAAKKKVVGKKRASTKRKRGDLKTRPKKKPQSVEEYFDKKNGGLKNAQHETFCQVWVQTFDFKQALTSAGYSCATLNEFHRQKSLLMKREDIPIRLQQIVEERMKGIRIDEDWVVLKMLETFQMCIQEKPIVGKEGDIVGFEYMDLKTAASTIKSLGENLGMFAKSQPKRRTVRLVLDYGNQGRAELEIEDDEDDEAAYPVQVRQVIPGRARRLN